MSSPFTVPNYGYPDRGTASSPALGNRAPEEAQGSGDVSVRQMRLKVLYTFDDQNKTNCLARWPQTLDIRTAYLDESTQIGVIELKTCIQAIVSASPELVAKLGQDYTVYAYDYSEYETPLVGQGMLSWVLASSSSTPSAPAHQSRTVVTGRVCKNILGLFSSSSQETLEVKLRLVPVPTSLQSEYIESMQKYRDLSRFMPEGFDAGAWTSFLQANPAMLQLANNSRSQSPVVSSAQKEFVGIEHVQRLLSQGSTTSTRRGLGEQRSWSYNDSYFSAEATELNPRAASPASSIQSATTTKRPRGRPPRAVSQTSVRGRGTQPKDLGRRDSVDTGFASNDEPFEEGPSKKRAKVTKADWPSKMAIGKQPDSLRVAASTAASVRIHQPTALRPLSNTANSLEGPPRAPTPVPDPTSVLRRPLLPAARSGLRRESLIAANVSYESPYGPTKVILKPTESTVTSPEDSQAGSSSNTPVDIASSPPVYRGVSSNPSSPKLPTMPRDVDSGFMSGSIDDLFEDDELRPLDDEDLEIAAQYQKRVELPIPSYAKSDVRPNVSTQFATEQQQQPEPKATPQIEKVATATASSRPPSRIASSETSPQPQVAANDLQRPSNLYSAQTWSSQQVQHPASDAVIFSEASEATGVPDRSIPHGDPKGGSGARRKKAIQTKLAATVAAGEIPPFCENCGAIETPTWRKAWVKVHSGTPEHVRISEEEGGIIAWQTLQTDENGVITLYRIVKKTVLSTDEGFTEILLCNPCGLWLHTRKCMRPKEVWEKTHSQRGPDEKRKRAPRAKKQKAESVANHAASDVSHGMAPPSDASSPANEDSQRGVVNEVPQLPPMNRQRAASVQVNSSKSKQDGLSDATAVGALQRAIQSSPARCIGTQHSPIDIDGLTPKPTRRLLFPSPTQSEEVRALGGLSGTWKSSQEVNPQAAKKYTNYVECDQADKENCPPVDDEEDLNVLFEENHRSLDRPTTPTPSGKNCSDSFNTPQKSTPPNQRRLTTGEFFSSAARALLLPPTTPKRTPSKAGTQPLGEMTPFTAHLNQLLSEANNGSPPASQFDFPSLPSLDNTPGRPRYGFDFSQFDPQDLLSTDVPMPSSPPAWFGVYVDPIEQGNGLWEDYELPVVTSPAADEAGVAKTPKTPGLTVDEHGHATIAF